MATKEHKFVRFAPGKVEIKAGANGFGELTGHCASTATLDEGGDIIAVGACKDVQEFIDSGWSAHSHDWTFKEAVGYIEDAHEDDLGLYVVSPFHSTPDAQNIRKIAQERLDAKKTVGLSIGYEITEAPIVIYPKDYETELPKWVRADALDDAMAKAKRFTKIRVLTKIGNFEFSLVTAPMNKNARAGGVKADGSPAPVIDVKGLFEDVVNEQTNSFSNLVRMLGFALDRLRWSARSSDDAGATLDVTGLLEEVLNEFGGRVTEAFMAAMESGDYWSSYYGGYYYDGRTAHEAKSLSGDKGAAPALTLAERSELAASACEGFANQSAALVQMLTQLAEDGKEKQEFRIKEGRTISTATANKITNAKTQIDDAVPALESVSGALADLLELASPKSGPDPEVLKLRAEFELMEFKRTQAQTAAA